MRTPNNQLPPRRSHVLAWLDSWPGRVIAAGSLLLSALLSPAWMAQSDVLCPFRLLTGLLCPGCGLTHAFVHLTHGDLGLAFDHHPFGPLVYAVFVVTVGWAVLHRWVRPMPDALRLWRLTAPVVAASWALWWTTQRLLPAVL